MGLTDLNILQGFTIDKLKKYDEAIIMYDRVLQKSKLFSDT